MIKSLWISLIFLILFIGEIKSQGIIITKGCNLILQKYSILNINNGGISCNGNLNNNGNVVFYGDSISLISGNNLIFYDLTINKNNYLKLLNDIKITNTLNLIKQNIDLNGNSIDLGFSGTLNGENDNSRITTSTTGYILKNIYLSNPSNINPGNIGIEITSSQTLGNTLIRRGINKQSLSSNYSIQRYFDIIPSNNQNLNASIKFNYFNKEVEGFNKDKLELFDSQDSGKTWIDIGFNDKNSTFNFVNKNNLNHLSRYTLGNSINIVLAMEDVDFVGRLKNSNVLLEWFMKTQKNESYFEIQKRSPIDSFKTFAILPANSSINSYNYLDSEKINGLKFYRLKIVDKNHNYFYSRIIKFQNQPQIFSLNVFPNPTYDLIKINILSNINIKTSLQIHDINGKMIFTEGLNLIMGPNYKECYFKNLPTGTYLISIDIPDTKPLKIIKL